MKKTNYQQLFSQNLRVLRKRRNKTQEDMATFLNIPRSTVNNYENSLAMPKIDILILLSEYFKISLDMMLKTDLQALRESEWWQVERGYDVFVSGSRLRVLTTTVDNAGNENIELVNDKAKAGYTRGYADPEFISTLPVFKLPFLAKERKYRTFQIKGDSMLPVPDGAWVTGTYVHNWRTLKNGDACIVITLHEGIVFKIIENHLEPEGYLMLISLNSEYKPYQILVSEISEIWIFTHFISNQIPEIINLQQLSSSVLQIRNDINMIKTNMNIAGNKNEV